MRNVLSLALSSQYFLRMSRPLWVDLPLSGGSYHKSNQRYYFGLHKARVTGFGSTTLSLAIRSSWAQLSRTQNLSAGLLAIISGVSTG